MSEILLSPGVSTRENDQSFISRRPIKVGAAIVGPTVKGPVEFPTVVTSYSEYINKFGGSFVSGSDTYSYFTSIAAYNYFLNGGESLLVTRVVTGSYTAASSSAISASTGASSQPAFVLETLSKGTIMNSTSSEDSNGALASGSSDNIRWEIVSNNTSSGTFDLVIRRGNDTQNNKVILETWSKLSLDPKSDNYVAKVIGDQTYTLTTEGSSYYLQLTGSYSNNSNYVRVKSVNLQTPNYFDNSGTAKNQYTASIPIVSSGSFGAATGTVKSGANFYELISNTDSQGLTSGCYTNAVGLLANTDDYKYNILLTPGLVDAFATHASPISSFLTNTQNRGDNLYVIDLVGYGSTLTSTVSQAASRNSSYGASYWPWVQTQDPETGKNVWVPASTMMGGVFAFNDKNEAPWIAAAGTSRGGLSTVIRAERKLSNTDRNTLYNGKVNPIATFPGYGVTAYGQKTLQASASALDRINVRRLLIELKSYISQIALTLVFEQNTNATRNSFLAQVNPYLSSVQQRQGLYAYKVVMNDTNNTAEVIDRNELIGQIFIQPTRTAEFIYLDFNITPTGTTFPV